MSTETFPYDAFLSHSAKDKAVVRPLAERLRQDGLKVWFDEWVLKPGDRIPAKIEPPPRPSYGGTGEGLEHSRMLACPAEAPERRRMLCMSATPNHSKPSLVTNAPSTINHRPSTSPRRFIPLRLDNAPIVARGCAENARCRHAELRP